MSTMATPPPLLVHVFEHVALPPRLPGGIKDESLHAIGDNLTDRLLDASDTLGYSMNDAFLEHFDKWSRIRRSLQTFKLLNAGGKLNKTTMLKEFRSLGRNDLLILHIVEQNAVLLIRRDGKKSTVIFEAFEASALSENVLASKSALQWDFPGSAVEMSHEQFSQAQFQEELSIFLEQASVETIKRFAARSGKAQSQAFESRDTVDPSLITQMLMTLLEVNGTRIQPTKLRKRVHDDVIWAPGISEKPWRRCPLWLALRVGIQRHLNTLFDTEPQLQCGKVHYKFLICVFLARLLDDASAAMEPDCVALLKAKLCRRMVKLEMGKDQATTRVRPTYEYLFYRLGPRLRNSAWNAVRSIDLSWQKAKVAMARPMGLLPKWPLEQDKHMTLRNSEPYLEQVMDSFSKDCDIQSTMKYKLPMGHSSPTAKATQNFVKRYTALSELEEEMEAVVSASASYRGDLEESCINIAAKVSKYLNAVADSYDFYPERKSYQLLTVMELWMTMDKCAVSVHPLLREFDTGFPPDILDVLQVDRFSDMRRLQAIRDYLKERHTSCKSPRLSIFVNPCNGCFAERFYDESPDLQELHSHIELHADSARARKEEEWKAMTLEFEDLMRAVEQSSCIFTTNPELPSHVVSVPIHDDRSCTKCFLQRKAKRFAIGIHEHFLPSSLIQTKAVIFELGRPKTFEAYRDTTWNIIATLGSPKVVAGMEPKVLLDECTALKSYARPCNFSLASTTKPFLRTHYARVTFPIVNFEEICRPNGLKLSYFDSLTNIWPSQQAQRPSFAHHVRVLLPKGSPFASSPDFAANSSDPTSYKIIASQTDAPSGLNIHEFMAFQSVASGTSRRWIQILSELGSSNLNFSSEGTAIAITHLALQIGRSNDGDPLGVVHSIFRDVEFCGRLLEQISGRLDGITINWRENHCMGMLITLIMRLLDLSNSASILTEAKTMLLRARGVTDAWVKSLRLEIQKAADIETSKRCSRYALAASLLCRSTFFHFEDEEILEPEALQCFIECSISLQDNLSGDPATLPLRNSIIRDILMTRRMRHLLRKSVLANPDHFISGINTFWPEVEGAPGKSLYIQFLENHQDGLWLELVIPAADEAICRAQTLQYHLLHGHLLIDFKPLGKLPVEYRESKIFKQLFGEQSLLIWPSPLKSMTYVLAITMLGNRVHLGFRDDGELFVRAVSPHSTLEYIPPEEFVCDETNFDLPTTLVDNVVHWLDLHSMVIEIRRKPDHIWSRSSGNWTIDLHTRRATRYNWTLIDPHSRLFKRVTDVFRYFERPENIAVMQQQDRSVTADIKRLELKFSVNSNGRLQSPQLQSEIDPNQDAGTFYGLHSKLVLRKSNNPKQRSIIVPMGKVTYQRQGYHVGVFVENEGFYTQFMINDILGRLDCPADPRLLYLKAELHAYTSFIIPDPLTGRTGGEEACAILESAYSDPWQPVEQKPHRSLMSIAKLTAKRCYYPEDMKVMQRVFWDGELTTTVQCEKLRPLVEAIIKQSDQLSVFSLQKTVLEELEPAGDTHLSARSHFRRLRYKRLNSKQDTDAATAEDNFYASRDRCRNTVSRVNVFEIATLIRNWPSAMSTIPDLAGTLQNWPIIEGYYYHAEPSESSLGAICNVHGYQEREFDKLILANTLTVELAANWGPLVNHCRALSHKDTSRLMFLLGVMSFRSDIDMRIIRTLLAFSMFEELKAVEPPKWQVYLEFRSNQSQIPCSQNLVQMMKPYLVPYSDSYSAVDREGIISLLSAKTRKKREAARRNYERDVEEDCGFLANFLIGQWPSPELTIEGFSRPVEIDVGGFLKALRPAWLRMYQNQDLADHLAQVQKILNHHHTDQGLLGLPKLAVMEVKQQVAQPIIYHAGELQFPRLLQDLLHKSGPNACEVLLPRNTSQDRSQQELSTACHNPPPSVNSPADKVSSEVKKIVQLSTALPLEMEELKRIVVGVAESQSLVRQQYSKDLMQSLLALEKRQKSEPNQKEDLPFSVADIADARKEVQHSFLRLCESFEKGDSRVPWLKDGGLWPVVTPVVMLEQLRSTCVPVFGSRMKLSIIHYALSVTRLQRLIRLENAYLKYDQRAVDSDLGNPGHTNWDPSKSNTDWLLFEIDANILIRPDQVEVARATISPASGSNSVLQMNMGQGKTSCIMPMVAAALADGKKLVRVVVPKPLLLQTAQLLQARLGGLVGRKLRHVPFSRKTSTHRDVVKTFYDIHTEIMKFSGVIVALPEHILSFFLSGQQCLSDAKTEAATQLIRVEGWMRKVCRDILDECDITLAVKTQLIYPSGSQKTVDGHPHRWEIAEALLSLVECHLFGLRKAFPRSIEVVQRSKGFPLMHFLRRDVEDALIARIVEDVCTAKTSLLPMKDCPRSDQMAVMRFISESRVDQSVIDHISHLFPDKPAARQIIYLLRGLLVHRILLLTLKKRWNVQYGIHPSRDPLAVPFSAKGVPSEQSDFGHPDVAILLTCLAFYYEGLSLEQLRQSLVHVLKSDDATSEYDRWTQNSDLPDSLCDWNAINVDDEVQLLEIWNHTRLNVDVINYFMNSFVFPKHAKQFQLKLLAAGWDIPLISLQTRDSSNGVSKYSPMTTGFSGTNDNRSMLPLTIKQADLPGLEHTNAEVLKTLLEHRNRNYVLAADGYGMRFSERDLLKNITDWNIQVLIDSGAQILEMDNLTLVKCWLEIALDAPAAVYFNEQNKPMVLYRQGRVLPLLGTPFADNLHTCLVYLDEAHTRGTDLKLPSDARGALTLGLGQTKDHTVQAAMRLRQLGSTQSVVFFAPPEVHQSILDLTRKHAGSYITSHDVIQWLIEQTCEGMEQLQPLYFAQGTDFCRRMQAAVDNPDFLVDDDQRDAYLKALRQNERQTIEKLYNPKLSKAPTTAGSWCPAIATFTKELKRRKRGFQDTGNAVHSSALQEVEQEREVAFEVENVREVQKPVHYSPLAFPGLHKDVLSFAMTGRTAGSGAYELAFVAMGKTSVGRRYVISNEGTTGRLYVSAEFPRTVKMPLGRTAQDNFQRPVNWILWSVVTDTALIVIPEEAERLLPLLRNVENPCAYLISYSAPVTRKMLRYFDDLDYYSVPNLPDHWEAPMWLKIELGIFAGRLYFHWEEYEHLLRFLGFSDTPESPVQTNGTEESAKADSLGGSVDSAEIQADAEKSNNVMKATELDFPEEPEPEPEEQLSSSSFQNSSSETPAEETVVGILSKQTKSFTKKPLTFLQEWLALRRKGQDFTHTPMGYVCQGKPLSEDHPFFGGGGCGWGNVPKLGRGVLAMRESDENCC